MASRIDVRPLTQRVHLHLRLDRVDADVSAEMTLADARILAARIVAAADAADRTKSLAGLIESLC
ncbi:MAG: hypothetical protein ACRYG8_22645 [Janthinobacterium lividum]